MQAWDVQGAGRAAFLDRVIGDATLGELARQLKLSPGDVADILYAARESGLGHTGFSEHVPLTIKGRWGSVFEYEDGRVVRTGFQAENLVVNAFALMISALLAQQINLNTGVYTIPTTSGNGNNGLVYYGITHMAIGEGDAGWDSVPPSGIPAVGDTTLVAEIATASGGRKACTVQHIDGSNNVVTAPTGRLLLTAVWNTGEAIGNHREFGLFGGYTATGTLADKDKGTMVNHVVHAKIPKQVGADFVLTRQVRLIF